MLGRLNSEITFMIVMDEAIYDMCNLRACDRDASIFITTYQIGITLSEHQHSINISLLYFWISF